jgi:hypothetical protein
MPKRSSKKQTRSTDENVLAKSVIDDIIYLTESDDFDKPAKEKNPAAVALGKLGGLKGGKARSKSLTPERRKEIAQKAAQSRWKTQSEK